MDIFYFEYLMAFLAPYILELDIRNILKLIHLYVTQFGLRNAAIFFVDNFDVNSKSNQGRNYSSLVEMK